MFKYFNLNKAYQVLLIILAFLMPLTVFGANVIVVTICLFWLFSGDYKFKLHQIISNKLMMASIIFFSLHLIGLIWTEDLSWGLHILHKMWYFLLFFPILYSITNRKYIKHYISAFLLAISLSELASYLVWFEIVEPFRQATVYNPTPFMGHIQYNPILAFAIYLVLHVIFFNDKLNKIELSLYSFFAITMSFNMFITGGRAGHVMFFSMVAILIFQYFGSQILKAIVISFIVVGGLFFSAYQSSTIFYDRVNETVSSIENYESNKKSSLGLRIAMTVNSWEVIIKNPLIGVGTGDFPLEYKKVNQKNTPSLPNSSNPHNMYILVLMQLGVMGLVSFLSIFYFQIKYSFLSKDKFIRDVGITLPLLYLIIMWSDTYLLGHYTSLLYIFFSSFLYKDFSKSQ
tara:strand:+ start:2123 stop:3325 length:1203 start_codon:yes stop_codon:yes gene_type:complete